MNARIQIAILLCALSAPVCLGQSWQPMGPPGGDVRTLTSDPSDKSRVFLGTADGHIFVSADAGGHWTLLGRAGTRLDSVITAIVVSPRDPQSLWTATWTRDPKAGGGVYRSADGGRTWSDAGLMGHAVRALAEAPSDSNVLIAGAVDGVFRSTNAGKTWERISPEGHEELRNFDSIAIDPGDARIIYAGTYHLPWKTTDGGVHWAPVHEGMIDDSDVMSILIDRTHTRRIFASACSGIYLSEDGASLWRKIQGIPYSARRTQAILQDADHAATVYAATTEGLWVTSNGGSNWKRLTPGDWVINSVALLPGRILIGTEKLGVLVSEDGGAHYRGANDGFFHRQIVALALDRQQQGRVLAVLANAPETLIVTKDGGTTWAPLGQGLRMQSVRKLYAAPGGWWAALERGGLMRYDAGKSTWANAGRLDSETASLIASANSTNKGRKAAPHPAGNNFADQVNDMAFCESTWFAATEHGLLRSADRGETWGILPLGPMPTLPVRSVRVSSNGTNLWVISLRGLVFSHDGGKTWAWHDLPEAAGAALWLDATMDGAEETIVANADNGLYISRDAGKSWTLAGSGIPQAEVQDLAIAGDTFLASMRAGGLYLSRDRGRSWTRVTGMLAEGFFPVVTTEDHAATLFVASATEGLYAIRFGNTAAQQTQPGGSQIH
ncbi:MAG TPA: hypothetical protein VLV89_02550 [Candidatus Acidoferrum sp.]|nr:hypothetical protein [Candidatus Acidoferrum sp.]